MPPGRQKKLLYESSKSYARPSDVSPLLSTQLAARTAEKLPQPVNKIVRLLPISQSKITQEAVCIVRTKKDKDPYHPWIDSSNDCRDCTQQKCETETDKYIRTLGEPPAFISPGNYRTDVNTPHNK